MNEIYLAQDIRHAIEANMAKIEAYGFEPFEETQLAYEYHFRSKNKTGDCINISFEAIPSTPIWVELNGTYIEKLSTDSELLSLQATLRELYKTDFDRYLQTSKIEYLESIFESYKKSGKTLNDQLINRVFECFELNLHELLTKSKIEEKSEKEITITPAYHTIADLAAMSKTPEFKSNFDRYEKMLIDTEKCEIELYSIEELENILEWLHSENIQQLDWRFI